jgi:hypothetical protein
VLVPGGDKADASVLSYAAQPFPGNPLAFDLPSKKQFLLQTRPRLLIWSLDYWMMAELKPHLIGRQ